MEIKNFFTNYNDGKNINKYRLMKHRIKLSLKAERFSYS